MAWSGLAYLYARLHLMPCVITPLVDDATWQQTLGSLPEWQPPVQAALVVAPHPDDETLGAGALIATLRAQGVPVTVVAATDGENCYDLSHEDRERIRQTRTDEQTRALRCLQVPGEAIHRLHLTDSGLHDLEAELTECLLALAEPGTHILTPHIGDFHPDHEACARAAATVARERGLQLTSYFFWTWHRGQATALDDLPVCRFVPDRAALDAKQAALRCHASQLAWEGCQPILPEALLGPAAWPFEVFLPA